MLYTVLFSFFVQNLCAELIPLNPVCPLSDYIISMNHYTSAQRVDIELTKDRLCSNPSIVLRLSGPSLYKLDYGGLSTQRKLIDIHR
jgi:hypothetical protein